MLNNESLKNFYKSQKRLEEALKVEVSDISIDGTIHRFKISYELAWKALKAFLNREGIQCNSPRDCFKGAFQSGYIKDEEAWLSMIKDRNLTSHIYDEAQAKKIYQRIKDNYFSLFQKLKKNLEDKI